MKKIITVLLIFVFAAQGCYTAVSAESTYDADELSKAVFVLNDLGIVSLQEDVSIWETRKMSRGEFAEMICKAFKLKTNSDKVYFSDVPYDMWAFKPISALAEFGYVSVPEDRKFRPDDTITYAEALKILLSASKYDIYAEYNGGFPYGYIKAASKLKLGAASDSETEVVYPTAIMLLYNVMSMGFYEPLGYSESGSVDYRESDDIIFAALWDTYIERGRLNAYYGAGLNTRVNESDEVIIDDTKYKLAKEMYLDDCFLNETEFIYKKTDSETKTIIYIEDAESKNDIVIDTDTLKSFDENSCSFEYYRNDTVVKKSFGRGATIIYNGSVYDGSIKGIFDEFISMEKRGTMRLKSINGGEADTLIIKSYRNFAAGYADAITNRIFNKFDSSDCIDMNDYEQVLKRNTEKAAISLDFSTLPMLLSVAESKDKSVLEITVCREKLTGTVEKIMGDANEKYFTVDGKDYKINPVTYKKQMFDRNGNEMSASAFIGAEYEFYIDCFGEIGYMSELGAGDGFKLGLLIDGIKTDDVFENKLKFKILTETSGIVEYIANDKLTVDNKLYKFDNINGIMTAMEKGAAVSGAKVKDGHLSKQIIRYKADENNRITEIDTASLESDENTDNTLSYVDGDANQGLAYKVTGGMPKFGDKILIDSEKTKFFAIPFVDDDGDLVVDSDATTNVLTGDIVIKNRSGNAVVHTKVIAPSGSAAKPTDSMYVSGAVGAFESDMKYPVSAYKYNPNTPYCDAVVYTYYTYNVPLENLMIEEFSEMYTDDGETAVMLTGWQRGERVSYEIADNSDISDLECGDIVYIWKDKTGKKVAFVKKIYDVGDDKFVNRPYTEAENRIFVDYVWACEWGTIDSSTGKLNIGYSRYNVLSKGLVLDKTGNTMRWDWDGNYRTFEETFDFSNIPIVICDRDAERNKVRIGTVAEVADCKSSGEENAARIVLNTDRKRGVCAFIYK